MTGGLDDVRRLRCRVVSRRLGPGPSPSDLISSFGGGAPVVGLIGDWAGGGAVLASEPLVVPAAGTDGFALVSVQPQLEPSDQDDVVAGGWFGWFAFDGTAELAFYDHLLRWRDGTWFFEALWSDERAAYLERRVADFSALLSQPQRDALPSEAEQSKGDTRPWDVTSFGGASLPHHLAAVEAAVEWIRAGEIYQANICTQLTARFQGSPAALFAQATDRLEPRFGAYAQGHDRIVACLSPELFLRRRGRQVMTSPIKGTWPRVEGSTSHALRESAKDAAENVMIVDLMRNDLGRVCEVGSVRASSLLDVEPHPGVWHLVSTVSGRLRADVEDGELLSATFPPGSVTGAPKLRALDAIGELEIPDRHVYTGAIGFASPSWGTELAVTIRTFEITDDRIDLGVGGGVTSDSVPMLEWRECLLKAAPLLRAIDAQLADGLMTPAIPPTAGQLAGGLLETILVVDESPVRLADHLARLDRSSRELYRCAIPSDSAARVREVARGGGPGRSMLRLVWRPRSELAIACTPLAEAPLSSDVRVVRGRTGLWRHKWAERSYLSSTEAPGTTPLFVGDDGTVLETSRGNVFMVCPDGELVTPPLADDVLPGVTRRALLDIARDQQRRTSVRRFTVAELAKHAAFWTSSLSGIVPILSIDGVTLPRMDPRTLAELRAILMPVGNAVASRPFVR